MLQEPRAPNDFQPNLRIILFEYALKTDFFTNVYLPYARILNSRDN